MVDELLISGNQSSIFYISTNGRKHLGKYNVYLLRSYIAIFEQTKGFRNKYLKIVHPRTYVKRGGNRSGDPGLKSKVESNNYCFEHRMKQDRSTSLHNPVVF